MLLIVCTLLHVAAVAIAMADTAAAVIAKKLLCITKDQDLFLEEVLSVF